MNKLSANVLLLWYDDDLDDLEYFKDILDSMGVSKYALCYNKCDFDKNTNLDINLVVIDHGLNEENGLQVLAEVKKQNAENFVMVVSGIRDPNIIIEYLNGGADRFVSKDDDNYRQKLIDGVKIGFAKAQERIAKANELAEIKAAKERMLTEHANTLIELIDRGTK